MRIWMIRAGRSSSLLDMFLQNGLAAIGWRVGSLAGVAGRGEIRQPAAPAATAEAEDAEADQLEEIRRDNYERSLELIKDRVQKLSWQEMQELVAGVLRALGFRTTVSPAGADRGKDIVASPDGLGLQSPRIRVEVKHRHGKAMGTHEVRSFIGGLHGVDSGL